MLRKKMIKLDGRVFRSSRIYKRRAKKMSVKEFKLLKEILQLSSSEVKKQFKYKVPLVIWVVEPIKLI